MSADFIGLDPDVDYEREYELKLHEMEQLKHSYDEYVESSREYERELETQLRQSDARHQELEKKIQVSELKYRSLQDNYDRICRDFTSTITNLQALQNSMVIIEDNNRKLENENEQLINHVRVLQTTEQDLIHKMNAYQEEIIFLKNDVEQLQENKINIENSLKNEILTLKEDVKRGLNHRRRKSHLNKPDFGMDSLDFNTQESELLAQTQENLELTVRELATVISELEAENADLQGQLFQAKKRLANGVVDRSLSLDPTDEVVLLKEEIEGLREVIAQKDTELAHFAHLQEVIEEKDERLRLIEKEFMEMLTPTFKAAKADTFYRMVPSSVGQNGSHLQIDSTTSVMGRLKSFLGTDDAEKLKKELIKMVGKYESERSRSVQLLHKIQTLQGNIIACCRTRPPSDQELAAGGKIIVDTMDDTELMFYDSRVDTWKSFAFDRVWKADKNQVDVFADVEPVIISVAEGYNACIMAYGQTGSGKTYTMDGYGDQYGLSYRTIQKLFETLETKKSNKNGSNKNLLALTTKSPRETPRTHHKKEFNGIGKSSSSHGATFEYVNPMISLSAPTGSASRRSSRATSASPADRYPAAFSPATASLNDSSSHEPLDVGIAGMSESVGGSVVGSGVNGSDSLDFSDRGDGIELVSDVEDDDDDEYDESHYSYTVEISMLEIYNEQVYDLLHDQYGGGQSDGVSLDLRTTPDNLVIVPGLRQYKVHDMDEVDTVFSRGAKNRATSSTNLNNQSSRSHLITIVEVTVEENEGTSSTGRLFLVDLAGSERINKSGAKGQVLKEAQYINKSLSALGDVMEALDSKQRHIPFRNSKLTYLLQNALGGNSKTMMIFTVCPTDLTSDETLFTLQFAQRVRNITLTTAHRNITAKNLEISVKMLKSELRDMKKKKLALEELLIENKKDNKKLLDKISAPLESKIRLLEEQKRSYEFNITNLQRQIQDINHKVDEEKTQRQQTLFDLELTQRNLKRALEVSKEYTIENDRLSSLLKNKENELESLKEAVTKTILTAPPPPPPPQQHQPLAQKRSPSSHNSPVSAAGSMTNGASIGSPRVNTTSTPSVVTPKPMPIVLYPRELNEVLEEGEKEEVVRGGEEDKPETETDHHRETEVYNTPQQTKNHQREEEEEVDDRYVTPSHSIYEKTPLNTPLPQVSPLSMSDTPVTLNSSSLTPLSKRLSPMAPGKLMPAHLVTTSSVTSLLGELQVEDAVRGREVAAEGGVSGGRGRESVIAGVTPNLTHRKIYQRKDPVPRQHHSASPTVGRLKRTDSHNSMGSMTSTPTSVHSTTSRSPSTSSSVTMRSQEALKKHQQRMEQKSLASLYKGKIY